MRQSRPGTKLRVFFQDEARFGQQGTLTRIWAPTGSRPRAVKQTRYEWVYLYAAAEPESGDSVALLLPYVDTEHMNGFLGVLSGHLKPGEHALLVMDNAGWHRSGRLEMPGNITPLYLPPYSPELNPMERLWGYLKSHHLSNRAYADYEAIKQRGCEAWRSLTPELIKSICTADYLTPEDQV